MRRAPSRASSSKLIVSSLRTASSVITLNMSRRSFLAGGGAPASFQHGQGGRYAAFSCQGLIHRFRRYLIGTVAGIQQAIGPVALAYFDLHSDLNTPATATDGALDWMALGHMLAVKGSEPTLTAAAGNAPSSTPATSCYSPMQCPTRPGSNEGRSSGWAWPAWHWKRSGATRREPPARRSNSSPTDPTTTPSISMSTWSTSPTLRSLSILRVTRG